MTQSRANLFSRIRSSIFWSPIFPQNERDRKKFLLNNLILHFRPRTVPEQSVRFTHTWGLGGIGAVLVLLLFFTGLLLKFIYEPFPGRAFDSIIILQQDVWFGQFVRNIHHWSANILVIVVFLHMLRVFFTGAFHPPRQFNWIIGLILFFLILISNFTGYLLPWDQLAFWAITICISMFEYIPFVGMWLQKLIMGGEEIGPQSLRTFFTLHSAIIPACLIMLMTFHFWRVRKAGGVVTPRSLRENSETSVRKVPTIPNLVLRELVVALILIAFILVFSIIFNAPLENKANPGLSPNPAKAPWYFLGMQELLLHFHPLFAVFIIPIFVIGFLIFLPYLKYDSDMTGSWFISQKGRKMAMVSAIFALIATPIGIIADEFFIDFTAWLPVLPTIITNGLLPAAIVATIAIGFYLLMKKKYTATNNESIQAVFILLLISFIILTITGIWFRGQGMALVWP